jgi:hypothetical protein
MGQNYRGNDRSPLAKLILLILVLIFIGPTALGIIVSVVVGLAGFLIVLLVGALFLLASPILMIAFPTALGLGIPLLALFFFGIAMLSIFVLFTALFFRIVRWIFRTAVAFLRRLLP